MSKKINWKNKSIKYKPLILELGTIKAVVQVSAETRDVFHRLFQERDANI